MIIDLNKVISWKDVEKIIEMAKKDIVVIRIPPGTYRNKKMKYKIEALKEIPTIFIAINRKERGRKPELDVDKIIEMLKEKSLTEVAELLEIPETTLYYHFDKHREEIEKERLERKMDEFERLMWAYKEMLVEKGLYDAYVESLFAELEMCIRNKNLEKAKKIIVEIISYVNAHLDDEE